MSTEFRYAEAAAEFRQDGSAVLRGVAMPYGAEARIGPHFVETVRAGAFGALGDVILNAHHDRAQPVARTDGGGLVLKDSETALELEAEIPAYRADLVDMLKRKILRGLSVEMRVKEDYWSAGGARREVRKAELVNIGIVDRPAYEGASLELAARARYQFKDPWPLLL